MTDDELVAIRARCEAATPGPWAWWRTPSEHTLDYPPNTPDEEWDGSDVEFLKFDYLFDASHNAILMGNWCNDGTAEVGVRSAADAAFVAHARQDVRALLAEIDRLRARGEAL